MQSAECRVQNAECRVQSAECRMQNAGAWVTRQRVHGCASSLTPFSCLHLPPYRLTLLPSYCLTVLPPYVGAFRNKYSPITPKEMLGSQAAVVGGTSPPIPMVRESCTSTKKTIAVTRLIATP